MEKKIRLQIRFFGCVQGVGFRWTAKNLASYYGLTGWVLNDWDGSVLMEVQGGKTEINAMIERLDSDRFIEIERMEKNELPLVDWEREFKIKH
ncbi:MAG: acylphosphatase [Treponema sp.]|nr:acylphosphatase [Treponema sp.]